MRACCRGDNMRRLGVAGGVASLVLVLASIVLAGLGTAGPGAAADPRSSGSQGPNRSAQQGGPRLREGTELVDQVGHFETAGDRLAFVMDPEGVRLLALENLNLERISRTIANHPGPLQWKISGIVTEHRGLNYLLVGRAIVRAVGDRPDASRP